MLNNYTFLVYVYDVLSRVSEFNIGLKDWAFCLLRQLFVGITEEVLQQTVSMGNS